MLRQLEVHLGVILVFLFTALHVNAQITVSNPSGRVVVEQPEDFTAPYKERRSQHAFLFGLHSENYYPFNYQSQFGSQAQSGNQFIEDMIGLDSIKLLGAELGYKWNISIGSISGLFDYSMGSANGTSTNPDDRIEVSRVALSANVALDGILNEPYIVPYGQVGVHQYNITEEQAIGGQIESRSGSSGPAFHYRYGLLFQVDWIEALMDQSAKIERLRSSGLENTFVDVYYSEYLPSSNAQDAANYGSEGSINTASSSEIGLGLKLEF